VLVFRCGGQVSHLVDKCHNWWTSVTFGGQVSHLVDECHIWWTSVTFGGRVSHLVDKCHIGGRVSHLVDKCHIWWTRVTFGGRVSHLVDKCHNFSFPDEIWQSFVPGRSDGERLPPGLAGLSIIGVDLSNPPVEIGTCSAVGVV